MLYLEPYKLLKMLIPQNMLNKGYGICFDEGGIFSEGSISNGRNVLIFGVHESSLVHSNNKANNIYDIYNIYVMSLFKESTTRHCMHAKYTFKILPNQAKNLF